MTRPISAYVGLWRSPLYSLGKVMFTNVVMLTGFEVAVLGLFGLMFVRRVVSSGKRSLDPVAGQAPRVLRLALVVSGATVAWLVLFGVARGGDFREALWQFRASMMVPVVCTVVTYALDVPRDLRWLAGVLVVGTVVKALLGAYFIYGVAFPSGNFPPHTTGHNDTIIFVTTTHRKPGGGVGASDLAPHLGRERGCGVRGSSNRCSIIDASPTSTSQ